MSPGTSLALNLEMFTNIRLMREETIGDRILEGTLSGAWFEYTIDSARMQIVFHRHHELTMDNVESFQMNEDMTYTVVRHNRRPAMDETEVYWVEIDRRYLYKKTQYGTSIRS